MSRILFWWGLAAAVGAFLLAVSLESLSVALGGLAAEPPLPPSDVLKLMGGVVLLDAMWHWTMPKSVRHSNSRRSLYCRR